MGSSLGGNNVLSFVLAEIFKCTFFIRQMNSIRQNMVRPRILNI